MDFSNPFYSSIQLSIDSHDLFQPLVKRVIDFCVNHGVPHLSLHFPRIVDELPHLFNCGSLRKLDLFEVVFMPNVKLDFVALKSLNLVKCSFVLDGEGVLDPFECCFNLEDLVVCDCRVPSRVKVLKISAPKLVDLTISKMEHLRNINGYCKIVVSSTKMRSFKLIESHILDYFIPFIERVEVDIVLDGYLSALRPFVRVFVEPYFPLYLYEHSELYLWKVKLSLIMFLPLTLLFLYWHSVICFSLCYVIIIIIE